MRNKSRVIPPRLSRQVRLVLVGMELSPKRLTPLFPTGRDRGPREFRPMGETPRRGRAAHRAHRQDRRRRSDRELLPSLREPPHRRCPPAANRHPRHRPPAAGYWTCVRANPSPRRARGRSWILRFPGREAPAKLPQVCSGRETRQPSQVPLADFLRFFMGAGSSEARASDLPRRLPEHARGRRVWRGAARTAIGHHGVQFPLTRLGVRSPQNGGRTTWPAPAWPREHSPIGRAEDVVRLAGVEPSDPLN